MECVLVRAHCDCVASLEDDEVVKNFVGRGICCENCENERSCILRFGSSVGRSNGKRSTDRDVQDYPIGGVIQL